MRVPKGKTRLLRMRRSVRSLSTTHRYWKATVAAEAGNDGTGDEQGNEMKLIRLSCWASGDQRPAMTGHHPWRKEGGERNVGIMLAFSDFLLCYIWRRGIQDGQRGLYNVFIAGCASEIMNTFFRFKYKS